MNERIKHHRAATLSLASVMRNGSGALIIAGAGLVSTASVVIAIVCLVAIKLPAIFYILRTVRV